MSGRRAIPPLVDRLAELAEECEAEAERQVNYAYGDKADLPARLLHAERATDLFDVADKLRARIERERAR